ncbi:MAG: 50S ribosomal protein L9 [Planctomycetes bacterium GWF2_50_10]|nr:MAG: 50S ribosomal protein L9 [Planctomycetes bacterium GWF2_50_10]
MKVLLCQDVEKLGWLGDIVEVSTGHARNFLFPQRIAIEASETNIKSLSEEKSKRSEQRRLVQAQLEKAAAAVNGAQVIIASKANEQGHLFGSVTSKEVAENLRGQGFEVADEIVKMDHIKEVGTYEVSLKFAGDLTASVKVVVVSQEEAVSETQEDK